MAGIAVSGGILVVSFAATGTVGAELGASVPSLASIGEYLVVGTKPMDADHAVNISQNELGADRSVITSDNGYGQAGFDPTVIEGQQTNVFPLVCYEAGSPMAGCEAATQDGPTSKASRALIPDFDSVFQADPSAPTNPSANSWFPGAPLAGFDDVSGAGTTNPVSAGSPGVDYLPYTGASPCATGALEARTFRGVDWSGNIAVTAPTGIFALSNVNLFANVGVRSTSAVAGDNISGSYYYPQGALTGTLMDPMDIGSGSGAEGPSAAKGWVGPYNHAGLVADLRSWRTYLRSLQAEATLTSDVQNESTIKGSAARVTCYADSLDANADGIVLVDILSPDTNNFFVSNSDWVIDGSGNKLIVFRLRNGRNMQVDNSSIMIGEGLASGGTNYSRIGVLFAHVHPDEEFTSTSGSSDTVFTIGQSIMNGIAMWDLNTIDPAGTDTDFGGEVDRTVQGNYTNISHNNTQGCGQFIAPRVNMQNVRWVKCVFGATPETSLDFGDLPDDSSSAASPSSPGYNTDATGTAGPSHTIVSGLRIGANEDAETAGQANATATGDDTNPVAGPDDEDGVTVPVITAGSPVAVSVAVANTTSAAATLCGYIDFDGDGAFTTAGEAATVSVPAAIPPDTAVTLNFVVPNDAVTSNQVGARFRLSTIACAPDGPGGDGEVEDLLVQITGSTPPTYAIGNYVWVDSDENGLQGDLEDPVAGVEVRLFGVADNEMLVGADGVLGTADDSTGGVATDSSGGYYFDALPAGQYYVTFSKPVGMSVTTDTPLIPNEASDSDADPLTLRTTTITLDESTPLIDGTDPVVLTADRINRDIDAGFVPIPIPTHELGDSVWDDSDNDGVMDVGETPISGVTLRLLMDDAANPGTFVAATAIGGAPVGDEVSGTDGSYRFVNLAAGTYKVVIPGDQAALGGYEPSGVPDPVADNDEDGDNNALVAGADFSSGAVTLGADEPTNEASGLVVGTPDADATPNDARNNSTVDFGFFRGVRIGNLVWLDGEAGTAGFDNGTADAGELPIAGVTLKLFEDDGDAVFEPLVDLSSATALTDDEGNYWFEVAPGIGYFVAIESIPGTSSSASSTGVSPDPLATDNTDDGSPTAGYLAVSSLVLAPQPGDGGTAEVDGLPVDDGSAEDEADAGTATYPDANSDLRVDFGFIGTPLYRLGNLVWHDDGDGMVEIGERPIEGVTVELYDSAGLLIESVVTGADGRYVFENLVLGEYEVRVPTDQLALVGLRTSPIDETSVNDDGDNNDSGTLALTGAYVTSGLVELGNGDLADEPTDELNVLGGDADDDTGEGLIPDDRGNFSVDFGFSDLPYALGDYVWYDSNRDGLQAGSEPPVVGATVQLFAADGMTPATRFDGATPVPTETTDDSGFYLFDNLAPGTYVVTFTHNQSGYRWTTPLNADAPFDSDAADINPTVPSTSTAAVTLAGDAANVREVVGTDVEANGGVEIAASLIDRTVDAGIWAPVAVGDVVWYDVDGDGKQGAATSEPGVPGVTVTLQLDGQPALDALGEPAVTTTNGDGRWVIDNVAPGTYSALFSGLPDGWTATDPNVGTAAEDSNIDTNGLTSTFTLTATAEGTMIPNTDPSIEALFIDPTVDAGLFRPMSVGDVVFRDADADGVFDSDTEPGVAGVTVELLDAALASVTDASASPVGPATTDASGRYSFDDLLPGDYVVRFTLPTGEVWTSANTPNDSLDSDADVATASPHADVAVELDPFAEPLIDDDPAGLELTNPTVDAGLFEPVSLGDLVWHDAVNDGIFDSAIEMGIPGVSVALMKAELSTPGELTAAKHVDGSAVESTVTDTDGRYMFDDLVPGNYVVEFTLRDGMRWTTANAPGDDTLDSDAIFVTTSDATARSGSVNVIDGMSVVDADTHASASSVTDPSLDAGLWSPLALGDIVWLDANKDGTIDLGEEPISGATVRLTDQSGEPVSDADGNLVADATTNVDGCYTFDNLAPGSYRVEFEHGLAGYRWTSVNDSNSPDNTDSDAGFDLETDVTATTEPVTLAANAINVTEVGPTHGCGTEPFATLIDPTIDAGIWAPLALGDRVWFDADKDGIQDDPTAEPGVPGVTVTLLDAPTGEVAVDADGKAVAPQLTDADGEYVFERLLPGEYIVALSTLPPSHSPTKQDQTTDGDDSDFDPDTLRSGVINLTIEGPSIVPNTDANIDATLIDRSVDGGIFASVSVGDLVWYDANRDGTFDPATESGIEGVTVTLLDADLEPVTSDIDGAPLAPLVTDVAGRYSFSNLPSAAYAVRFALPNGYQWTVADAAAAGELLDSDAVHASTTGATAQSLVRAVSIMEPVADADSSPDRRSATDPGFDAGVWMPLAIGDKVFVDVGEDGLQDSSARPHAGATVRLLMADGTTTASDADGVPVPSSVTDANGHYLFDNLLPGVYVAEFEHRRAGMRWATPNAGDDSLDSDAVYASSSQTTAEVTIELSAESDGVNAVTADHEATFGRTLRAALIDTSIDAGIIAIVAVGDEVWLDHDYDGVRDEIDGGVAGVTVTLLDGAGQPALDADGTTVPPVVTANDGTYVFDGLRPDNYIVEFSDLPVGHEPTSTDSGSDDSLDSDAVEISEGTARTSVFYLDYVGSPMSIPDPTDELDAAAIDPTRDLGLTRTPGLSVRKYATVEALSIAYDPADPATLGCDANTLPDDGSEPDPCQIAEFGGLAVYRIVVTNTGHVDLSPPRLTDRVQNAPLVCENLRRIHPAAVGNTFPVGAQWVYQCEVDDVRYNFTNEATAEAEPVLPDGTPIPEAPTVSASDIAKMDPAQLVVDMGLNKELIEGPLADGSFRWNIDVTNLGPDVAWGPITVIDDLPDGFRGNVSSGDGWACSNTGPDNRRVMCTTGGNIAVGVTSSIVVSATLTAPLAGEFANEAYFVGMPPDVPRNSGDGDHAGALPPAPSPTAETMNPSLTITEEQGAATDAVPVEVFDLASSIVYLSDTAGDPTDAEVSAGSTAKFRIIVVNQGNVDAAGVNPVVYLPTALQLNDNRWQLDSSVATLRKPLVVPAGQTVEEIITLRVTGSTAAELTIWHEIAAAANSGTLLDRDSTPDRDQGNDVYIADNEVSGNGKTQGDEDDHDPASLSVVQSASKPTLPTTGAGPVRIVLAGLFAVSTGAILLSSRNRRRQLRSRQ